MMEVEAENRGIWLLGVAGVTSVRHSQLLELGHNLQEFVKGENIKKAHYIYN